MSSTTDYSTARAALGLAPPLDSGQLARCSTPGCPVRWTTGPDRTCPDHQEDPHIAEYLALRAEHADYELAELPASVMPAAPTRARRAHAPR